VQTTLQHVVGAQAVQSVMTEREAIAFEIAEIVGDIADKWGVGIEGILIKDIIFSAEVSASLSSTAQQKRIGKSKVIDQRLSTTFTPRLPTLRHTTPCASHA